MWRTVLASLVLLLGGYAAASWLTHDFQVWTAEGARRLEVALAPLAPPAVVVEGHAVSAQPLPALLGQGEAVTIVDFVYTRCQTVCLSLGTSFQQMQAALAKDPAARVQLLSVSFDPRDSVADLQAYAARMQADPRHWRFVRAQDSDGLRQLLATYQVTVVPDGRGDFEHNAAFLVVDAAGRLVRIFDLAEQELAWNYALHLAQGPQP